MPRDPRAYLQRAEEHRRHGRLKEAIALSIEALAKHPGLDAVRVTLGRAYLENAQPEEARTTLQDVFARLPEHHLAGKLLIESQRLLGDLPAAAATCRTLLEHYPRDREIEPLLAEIVRAQAAPGAAAAPAATDEADPEPDYLPEDLGAERSATPGPVASTPKPTAPAPGLSSLQIDKAIEAARAPIPATAPATKAPPVTSKPTVSEPPAMPPVNRAPAPAAPVPAAKAPETAPAPVASSPAPAPTPAPVPAAPARAAMPAAAAADSASAASKRDALETNTLAELYVKQGLPDRAIDVYRSMLRVEPGNAAARRRLAELEAAQAAAPVQATKPAPAPAKASSTAPPAVSKPKASTAPDPAVAEPPPVPAVTAASAAPPGNAAHPNRAAIERLERWLDGVKRGQKDLDDGAAA